MPLKDNFIFKEVAKEYMMVPLLNGNVNMSKVINLNETGAFIIKKLKEKDSIDYVVDEMTKEYDVSKEDALNDIKEFVELLKKRGFYE
jgi:hypothetical protein